MASSRRITWPLLTTILLLVSSVTAHLEQPTIMAAIPRLPQSPETVEKTATAMRFLRGDGKNEATNNEERGAIMDKVINIPALKWALKLSLRRSEDPAKLLQQFHQRGYTLKENYMLVWLEYVLSYRTKLGSHWATDAYTIKTLKETIPDIDLPKLFQAMEKNDNLRNFAEALKKEAAKSVKREN
ncbi:RxLR effector protein [Phytophthora megakarya]|uniref:RxLR effector protein n=1 Tax=Phytophthora megakarya TaxID=4795 RepID=A0A225V1T2_9STRA|nr:RxLR effector protein [Phytophthora megakarya]